MKRSIFSLAPCNKARTTVWCIATHKCTVFCLLSPFARKEGYGASYYLCPKRLGHNLLRNIFAICVFVESKAYHSKACTFRLHVSIFKISFEFKTVENRVSQYVFLDGGGLRDFAKQPKRPKWAVKHGQRLTKYQVKIWLRNVLLRRIFWNFILHMSVWLIQCLLLGSFLSIHQLEATS